jgi:hypothetical protein
MKIDPKELIFRHYTSDKYLSEYHPECIVDTRPTISYKPCGIWGSPSPVNENISEFYTWKDWLINNNYEEDDPTVFGSKYFFDFKIKDNAKILSILKLSDTAKYIKYINKDILSDEFLKIDKSLYKDYDGVFLYHGKNYNEIHFMYQFNCWDVDSIVIWNPEMIIPIKRKGE